MSAREMTVVLGSVSGSFCATRAAVTTTSCEGSSPACANVAEAAPAGPVSMAKAAVLIPVSLGRHESPPGAPTEERIVPFDTALSLTPGSRDATVGGRRVRGFVQGSASGRQREARPYN